MKVQTTAGHLRAGLRLFRGIIERRNAIPALGMVRFRDGKITGTDLDTELSVSLPSIGDMEGAAAIDWHGLDVLAGCLDGGHEVTIAEDDGGATAAFNGSLYRMASVPPADFPDFGPVTGARTSIGNLGLAAAIRRVRCAMSSEETRYYLNGVALLTGPDGGALVAATDGRRLAMQPLDTLPDGAAGAIVPKNVVHWLCARKQEPEACTFGGEKPVMRLEYAGMTLSAKLIDGTFPDIFRVVPRAPKPVFTIEREGLLRVLMRMRAFSPGRFKAVRMTGEGGVMTLEMTLHDWNRQATERLDLEGGAVAPFVVGYNVDYLISALSGLCGDRVTFAADAGLADAPCVISSEDDTLRIVQMPMRV